MTDLSRLRAQIEAFVPYNEQEEADRRQMLADVGRLLRSPYA